MTSEKDLSKPKNSSNDNLNSNISISFQFKQFAKENEDPS